jgi:signal transduction histidine kinase
VNWAAPQDPCLAERVLVLVRGARDGALTAQLLGEAGFAASVCANVGELCARIEEGAGAALLAEEVLAGDVVARLGETLSRQPPWSDFPVIIFGGGKGAVAPAQDDDMRVLGNVTFLDRPVRTRSMLASVHAAIRSRRRQYEARTAIDSRDRFLAMLGHELRNPVGAIRLASAMLDKKTPAPPRELAIIGRQSTHLARLVDDLLDVARVTHGKVVLKLEEVDLVQVVHGAFEAHEARARERGLSYELRAPPCVIGVNGDRQRLEQVLANLLTNALKYTPPGGAVTVTVRAEGASAEVEVTDTGIGIAPEMLGRVFDAFAQADRALDRAEGGIGLGLALVRSVVQLHGGAVEASSEGPGRGSSFLVRIPRIETQPVARASGPRLEPRSCGKRVVVVEDSADIRELLVDMLAEDGHDVSCADDGPHGLEEILRVTPDVAFVDVGLPGFDGFELARRARASGSTARLVAVTGYGQPEDRRHAFDAGFDDHLTKPVGESDLQRAMQGASPPH